MILLKAIIEELVELWVLGALCEEDVIVILRRWLIEMVVVECDLERELAVEGSQVVIGVAMLGRAGLEVMHKICRVM